MVATAGVGGIEHKYTNMDMKVDKLYAVTDAAAVITTTGAATYTAAQIIGGFILRDCSGSGRTDVLPTAALMVAAMPNPKIGDTVSVLVMNNSDAAETITISAGSGGALTQIAGTRIIPQNTSRRVYVRLTNVTSGSEAYVAYM